MPLQSNFDTEGMRWGGVVTSKLEVSRARVPDFLIFRNFDSIFPNTYERLAMAH